MFISLIYHTYQHFFFHQNDIPYLHIQNFKKTPNLKLKRLCKDMLKKIVKN